MAAVLEGIIDFIVAFIVTGPFYKLKKKKIIMEVWFYGHKRHLNANLIRIEKYQK